MHSSVLLLMMIPGAEPVDAQVFRSAGPQNEWTDFYLEVGDGIADLNQDGTPDFLTSSRRAGGAFAYNLNDGTGRMGSWVYVPLPAHLARDYFQLRGCTTIDIDEDGDLDVLGVSVLTSSATTRPPFLWHVFLNDGDETFTLEPGSRFAAHPVEAPFSIVPCDINGDGDVDLITLNATAQPSFIRLLLNDGNGHFAELPNAIPNSTNGATRIAIADLDVDGDPDIAYAVPGGPCGTWLNDGSGRFTTGTIFPSTTSSRTVKIHDVDRDGLPDILFANFGVINHPPLEAWINDRAGGFRYEGARFPPIGPDGYRHRFDLADLDMDGLLDVFIWGVREAFLDDGTGHYIDGVAALGLPTAGNGRWPSHALDIDRDGDTDLIVPRVATPGEILANTHRNVFTDSPAVGGTLHIDLYAPPGNLATYLLGFARRDLFIPGIGWSGLDPNLSAPWPVADIVPPSGRLALTLPVPLDPGLRGLPLWAQAVDADRRTGPTLGNLWPITFR
jgi:hypothetical protein